MEATETTRLWVSEVGRCPRSGMLRVFGFEPTREFPQIVKDAMQFGHEKEAETLETILSELGPERITSQVRVGNALWSGKADIIIDHGTNRALIVEHKAVFGRWKGSDCLRLSDVAQVCLYGQLYRELTGKKPALLLFYRGRGASITFELYPTVMTPDSIEAWGIEVLEEPLTKILLDRIGDHIPFIGIPMDRRHQKQIAFDVSKRRTELETYYQTRTLPPRLATQEDGHCTFNGTPSCLMYDHCWPDAVTL